MTWIAGDVGGTKTLLRCVDASGATLVEGRYDSGAYATFDALLREFLDRAPQPFEAACFAVAGPVFGARAEITNIGWVMEAGALSERFGIPRVALVNDFFAIALGVPLLGEDDLLPLHRGERDRHAPIGILGAGTGLGEAIVVPHDGVFHVVPSEGGHQDFAPQDEEQTRLFLYLKEKYGEHVSWERLLSGMGLVNIFTFLGGQEITPAEIAELADCGDLRATRTMEIFVDVYGAEAGNMALRVLARGGIFLAGGIAAKNGKRFTDGRFVEAFLRKGRFRPLMEKIPVDLIVNEEVGLIGAVEGARRLGGELKIEN
ncbi:MAG TPA: glucokinase [Thermoanaerobaculia bacterium]|nr:glucokinase [Thermoanaerobaculia bacterium]